MKRSMSRPPICTIKWSMNSSSTKYLQRHNFEFVRKGIHLHSQARVHGSFCNVLDLTTSRCMTLTWKAWKPSAWKGCSWSDLPSSPGQSSWDQQWSKPRRPGNRSTEPRVAGNCTVTVYRSMFVQTHAHILMLLSLTITDHLGSQQCVIPEGNVSISDLGNAKTIQRPGVKMQNRYNQFETWTVKSTTRLQTPAVSNTHYQVHRKDAVTDYYYECCSQG